MPHDMCREKSEQHLDRRLALFRIVYNDARHYSIWPTSKQLPAGWKAIYFVGDEEDCLQHIANGLCPTADTQKDRVAFYKSNLNDGAR